MDPIVIVCIVVVLLLGAAVGILFAIPKTRPYIKKWWPVAIVVGATVLIALLFRRKPAGVNNDNVGDLDIAVQEAKNKLVEEQIRTEASHETANVEEKHIHEELERVNKIDDPFERHAAKKRLLDSVRGQ